VITEYELITDSYEQPIERPQDYEEQKKYYSGKKARGQNQLSRRRKSRGIKN
jgi:hypothetical protein